MGLGLHVIADMMAEYGNVLAREERLLDTKISITSHYSLKLADAVKNLSSNLLIISLWISQGKAQEDVSLRISEIKKYSEILKTTDVKLTLLSDDQTTYLKIAEKIESAIVNYYEAIKPVDVQEQVANTQKILDAYKRESALFWEELKRKREENNKLDTRSAAASSSQNNDTHHIDLKNTKHGGSSPSNTNGIKAH